jgi:hypothetical protein
VPIVRSTFRQRATAGRTKIWSAKRTAFVVILHGKRDTAGSYTWFLYEPAIPQHRGQIVRQRALSPKWPKRECYGPWPGGRVSSRIHNPSPFVQTGASLSLLRQTAAYEPVSFVG